MGAVVVCFDTARRIGRVDVEGIEVSTQLLDGLEALNDGGTGFEHGAPGGWRLAYCSAGIDTPLHVRACHGL